MFSVRAFTPALFIIIRYIAYMFVDIAVEIQYSRKLKLKESLENELKYMYMSHNISYMSIMIGKLKHQVILNIS